MRKVGVEEQHRDGEERVVIKHVAKRRADRGVEHDLQKVEKPRRHERHHQKIHKEEDRSGDALGMVHAAGGGFLFCHGKTSFPGKLRKLLLELVEKLHRLDGGHRVGLGAANGGKHLSLADRVEADLLGFLARLCLICSPLLQLF